jgi:hypothetical protein
MDRIAARLLSYETVKSSLTNTSDHRVTTTYVAISNTPTIARKIQLDAMQVVVKTEVVVCSVTTAIASSGQ